MEKSFYIVMTVLFLAVIAGVLSGCASLESKAVAMGHGVDAFSVQTAGSLASGTVLPNIIADSGGICADKAQFILRRAVRHRCLNRVCQLYRRGWRNRRRNRTAT